MQFTAFDLEIAKEIPTGSDDWKALRPLGISCAATYSSEGETLTWHGVPKMTPEQCRGMADYLLQQHEAGYLVVTWNGLGFDFDVLAEECQSPDYTDALKALALDHIDVAFAMFCEKGFMIGLETAAKGQDLQGKTEGMHGDLAPVMWKQGEDERAKVLEYVQQDAVVTANVYRALVDNKKLRWTSRTGRTNYWFCGEVISTVRESLAKPEPDTSWMSDPWPRSKFAEWATS